VPSSAAPPAENALHALLTSAKATADALLPCLTLCKPNGTSVTCAIRKAVSCQRFYSALLRSDGTLLLLRSTSIGTSGDATLPPPSTYAARVSVLESGGEAVRDVAAGAHHIVYCTASGAVYSCGYDNTYGQLGDATVWSASSPLTSAAAAMGEASLPPLSTPKRIAVFGDFCQDVCGAASASPENGAAAEAPAPSKRHVPPPCSRRIRQVACGAYHTLLLTSSGRCVYACGRGDRGELGGTRAVLLQPSFRSISLLFGLEMRQVAAADAHSFVLLESGLLYAFGDNVCGQLGLGHTKRVSKPTRVPLTWQAGVKESSSNSISHAASVPDAGTRQRVLDEKTYASLRAPYGSVESTYYPLRVPRLQAERAESSDTARKECGAAVSSLATADAVDVRVQWVHCCVSWTLLETSRSDVWLSCGTALTRGTASNAVGGLADAQSTQTSRLDGCGVLGRPLLNGNRADAYLFLPVRWAPLLKAGGRSNWDLQATPPAWTRDDVLKKTEHSGSLDTRCTCEPEDREAASSRHYTTATGKGITIPHGNSANTRAFPRRTTDTELSLCHTKKNVKGVEENADGLRVYPYPTSLLVLCGESNGDEEGWTRAGGVHGAQNEHPGLLTSTLLVQNGNLATMAVEVSCSNAAAWTVMRGCAVDERTASTEVNAPDRMPCGASVLKLHSSHGQLIPLPSYTLLI
jgi:hypothetical protein